MSDQKLLLEQFSRPDLVEVKKIGSQMVWHYNGTSLAGYAQFADTVLRNGATFFDIATQVPFGPSTQTLDEGQAALLLGFEHMRRDGKTRVKFPSEFPHVDESQARGYTTNYSYLVHFGLLEKDRKEGCLKYSMTPLGVAFANETAKCPSQVVNIKDRVLAKYGEVHIRELIPNIDEVDHKWWVVAEEVAA